MTDDPIHNDDELTDPDAIEAALGEDDEVVATPIDPEEDHESVDKLLEEELEEDEELDTYDDKDKF